MATAILPALLGGCQCFWPHPAVPEAATGADPGAVTASAPACPDITKAEAWVDRMPRVGAPSGKLVVVLGIASDEKWMLAPLDMPAARGLMLDFKPGGNSVPGTVAYRQAQPSPLPEAIRILCRGQEVARIDRILVVQ